MKKRALSDLFNGKLSLKEAEAMVREDEVKALQDIYKKWNDLAWKMKRRERQRNGP